MQKIVGLQKIYIFVKLFPGLRIQWAALPLHGGSK
jgi:hypothetical protein